MRFPTCVLMAAALTCLPVATDLCAERPGKGRALAGLVEDRSIRCECPP